MGKVEQFYDENVQYEWERLERHRTEFAVTMRALGDYLPKPPANVLDVGGGPGRYALALAGQGYQVTLVDLSKGCLDFARDRATKAGVELADYVHANAMNLGHLPGESYDSALLMGPLYHLFTLEERQQTVRESSRVLKAGGFLFATFITRYAPVRWMAKVDPAWIIEQRQRFEEMLAMGVQRTHPETEAGFTDAYFAHPSEIRPLIEHSGFETVDLIACEGVVSMIEEQINELTGDLWQAWVELNYRLGKDPSVHGAAEHLLYVGRKL